MDITTISQKFTKLKWSGAAQILKQCSLPESLSSTQVLNLLNELIEGQMSYLDVNRQIRLKRVAKLRWPDVGVSDIDVRDQKPNVVKNVEHSLKTNWVRNNGNVAIIGKTGVGKTTLACAIANSLLEQGVGVLFIRYPQLIVDLCAAEKQDTLPQLMKKLMKFPVLLIDDWGIMPLNTMQRHLVFELIERRELNSSLIITSQYGFEHWHQAFQDEVVGDSVLDRIKHLSIEIFLERDSLRKRHGLTGEKE